MRDFVILIGSFGSAITFPITANETRFRSIHKYSIDFIERKLHYTIHHLWKYFEQGNLTYFHGRSWLNCGSNTDEESQRITGSQILYY